MVEWKEILRGSMLMCPSQRKVIPVSGGSRRLVPKPVCIV